MNNECSEKIISLFDWKNRKKIVTFDSEKNVNLSDWKSDFSKPQFAEMLQKIVIFNLN